MVSVKAGYWITQITYMHEQLNKEKLGYSSACVIMHGQCVQHLIVHIGDFLSYLLDRIIIKLIKMWPSGTLESHNVNTNCKLYLNL